MLPCCTMKPYSELPILAHHYFCIALTNICDDEYPDESRMLYGSMARRSHFRSVSYAKSETAAAGLLGFFFFLSTGSGAV